MSQEIIRREEQRPESYRDRVPLLSPPVDIFENEQEILLVADLPGVDEEALSIQLEKNELTLQARRPAEEAPGTALAREYRDASYYRSFVVPQGIDAAKVSATLEGGVLKVHLPKAEGLRPRRIEVKSG
jgi:HSP20 family protein